MTNPKEPWESGVGKVEEEEGESRGGRAKDGLVLTFGVGKSKGSM